MTISQNCCFFSLPVYLSRVLRVLTALIFAQSLLISHSLLIICLPTCTEHCLEKGPCLIHLCLASTWQSACHTVQVECVCCMHIFVYTLLFSKHIHVHELIRPSQNSVSLQARIPSFYRISISLKIKSVLVWQMKKLGISERLCGFWRAYN